MRSIRTCAILDETRQADPKTAIRAKALAHIDLFCSAFPGAAPPFNMEALASLRDIRESDDPPAFSDDSELVPDGEGGVLMRVNRNRPRSRQRFSVGHEIGHTFFPEYQEKVRCRKEKERDWADPDDVIETLCDVAASEFLFPLAWFESDAALKGGTADGLLQSALDYHASPDATVRRYVEISKQPIAAVFLTWKLKPTQISECETDGPARPVWHQRRRQHGGQAQGRIHDPQSFTGTASAVRAARQIGREPRLHLRGRRR